ncbi:MAG: hypothetical protein KDA79_03030 [Planctomycetaceae bacterium]|nr:hypothetical protein [Planctomycetaceae bacterium]
MQRFLAEHSELLRRQGSVVESWRQYRDRRLGPYYRLAYRDGERQCSVYLGRDPNLADEVRQTLERLQAPGQDRRRRLRNRDALRRAVARSRAAWNAELRKSGLWLKGGEVRGWRKCRGKTPSGADAPSEGTLTGVNDVDHEDV